MSRQKYPTKTSSSKTLQIARTGRWSLDLLVWRSRVGTYLSFCLLAFLLVVPYYNVLLLNIYKAFGGRKVYVLCYFFLSMSCRSRWKVYDPFPFFLVWTGPLLSVQDCGVKRWRGTRLAALDTWTHFPTVNHNNCWKWPDDVLFSLNPLNVLVNMLKCVTTSAWDGHFAHKLS